MSKIRKISMLNSEELDRQFTILSEMLLKNNNEKKIFMENYTTKNRKIKKDLLNIKKLQLIKKKEITTIKEKKLKSVCVKFKETTKNINAAKKHIKSEKLKIKKINKKPDKKITVKSIKDYFKENGIKFKSSYKKDKLIDLARAKGVLRKCYV
jgi:hypothetical protein